jgi:hypothetical protein
MSEGKRCPQCGGKMRTVDSRAHASPDVLVRRRNACDECGARFTTHEIVVDDMHAAGNVMATVAAHDRAVAALGEMLAHIDPQDLNTARWSLGHLRRKDK